MRTRFVAVLLLLVATASISAKDAYLSIGGSVGNFRTDARIFNPSFDKDIVVEARYLPAGNSDNGAVAPKSITIARRTMAVYDNVVQSLFGGGAALGAVRLTSSDDFVATQRIYADESANAQNGTLGQFVPGLDLSQALRKGVLVQLKQNGSRGQKGTFRTNWGGVNPNPVVANISFKLFDRSNTLAGTNDLTLQPFGVFSPTNILAFFGNPSRDLGDAWISFESDQPVFLYASVLDNGSEDPTFVPASGDSGVEPAPQTVNIAVTARNWNFTFAPAGAMRRGDVARFRMHSEQDTHGFRVVSPSGQILFTVDPLDATEVVREVTLSESGTYFYACTHSACGAGHFSMTGSFDVSP